MKHTPAPWIAAYNGDETCIGTKDGEFIASTLSCASDVATQKDYDNAQLIAAAPDLLAAAIATCSNLADQGATEEELQDLWGAIAKATGEEAQQ